MYSKNMHKSKLKQLLLIMFRYLLIPLFLLLGFVSNIHAQSLSDINFTLSLDKASISPGDSFTVTYTITNNSTTSSAYNLKVTFPYIESLDSTTSQSSSTGQTKDTLKANGYSIPTLTPSKSTSFTITFLTSSSIATGSKINNKSDSSQSITSPLTFTFSTDPSSPTYTANGTVALPDVSAPKPAVADLKYPNGIKGYDLSKIDSNNAKAVSGFYLEGKNKISFTENVDLSSDEAINIIKNLNNFFDLNSEGSVRIAPNNVFNKKANVEIRNAKFIDTPALFLEDSKYTKPVTYDTKTKLAKFDIDGVGKYTLVPEVKTTVPLVFTTKDAQIDGTLTDPLAMLEIEWGDGIKDRVLVVNIDDGKFTAKHTYKEGGEKQISINSYAKNGVVNKQLFTSNVTDVNTTPVPASTTPTTQLKDQDYFKLLLVIGIVLLVLTIIIIGFLTFYSLKRRKLKKSDSDILPIIEGIQVKGPFDDESKTSSSDNRHEVIKSKIDSVKKDPIDSSESSAVKQPEPSSETILKDNIEKEE